MPNPSITIPSEDEDESPPTNRPKPLISVPLLSTSFDGSSSEESGSDDEDVMTAEEEAAARRYLSGGAQTEQRRLSSLDVYLSQPQPTAEPLIIHRRLSMRDEEEAVAKMNAADEEAEAEEVRRLRLQQEREAVKREREAKKEKKHLDGPRRSLSPASRKRPTTKRGFGGLDKEKRKKLKEIIMKKAKEELQSERLREMHAREDYLQSTVPSVSLDGLSENQLQNLILSWHSQAQRSMEQRLELEDRIRRQDEEIQCLTARLIDIKGKYPMPILRKVPKNEHIFARLEKLRTVNAMRGINPDLLTRTRVKASPKTISDSSAINGIDEEAEEERK